MMSSNPFCQAKLIKDIKESNFKDLISENQYKSKVLFCYDERTWTGTASDTNGTTMKMKKNGLHILLNCQMMVNLIAINHLKEENISRKKHIIN